MANVDLAPTGPDRFPVITGEKKMFNFDEEHFYPAQEAIDMYHRYKEDIALFGEMGFKHTVYPLLGVEFFQWEMKQSRMKKA